MQRSEAPCPCLTNQIFPHGSQYDDSSMIQAHESLLLLLICGEGETNTMFTAAANYTVTL